MADYIIENFGGGLNESVHASLIQKNEASNLLNADFSDGALKPSKDLASFLATCPINITRLMVYHEAGTHKFVVSGGANLYLYNGSAWVLLASNFTSDLFDYINYNYNGTDVMILVNGVDNNKILTGTTLTDMKDRRIHYDALGVIDGYYDANGVLKATEAEVTTLAPKAYFVELHYERIWLADKKSVYFSKDFDPQDYTVPTDELEANMHGGEIVMESFDATNIIGLKVVYDDVCIFKEKSLFKITGAYAEQYTKQQLFTFNGAIADGSIVATSGGCFFLNHDGIYLYDGVNCTLVSQKIGRTVATFYATDLAKAKGANHRGKYMLCIPIVATPTNKWQVIEFDYVRGTFSKHDIAVTGFLEIIDDLYATKGTAVIYKWGTGTYLPLLWETGYSDLGVPNAIKENEDVYFQGKGDEVIVTCTTEKKDKTKTIALTANNFVYHKSLINYGRLMKFKFATTATKYCEIIGFKAIMDIDED